MRLLSDLPGARFHVHAKVCPRHAGVCCTINCSDSACCESQADTQRLHYQHFHTEHPATGMSRGQGWEVELILEYAYKDLHTDAQYL